MATPIGHSLFGLAIATAFYPYALNSRYTESSHLNKKLLGYFLISIFLANVPDLDFIPGFLANNPGLYHRMASHSVFSALVVAPFFAFLIGLWDGWPFSFAKSSLVVLIILLSHLLADYVAVDGSFPYGMMALWPLNSGWYTSPITILGPVIKGPVGTDILGFFLAACTAENLKTIWRECWLGALLLLCAIMYRRYRAAN